MKTVISVCPVKASENMHTKAVFIEDEMVSLWPPTVHLHDALMNLSCRTLAGPALKGKERGLRSITNTGFLEILFVRQRCCLRENLAHLKFPRNREGGR